MPDKKKYKVSIYICRPLSRLDGQSLGLPERPTTLS